MIVGGDMAVGRSARYVVAPQVYREQGPAVYLAGGITGCPDWQTEAVRLLRRARVECAVLNPRRPVFPPDVNAAAEQVAWEYRHLQIADAVLFWFPATSLQPIALYELGACAAGVKPIVVGADHSYSRRHDLVLQLSHARPDLKIHSSLPRAIADVVDICRALDQFTA